MPFTVHCTSCPYWLYYTPSSVDWYVSHLGAKMFFQSHLAPLSPLTFFITSLTLFGPFSHVDYAFPYLSIIISMISNAAHFSMKLEQNMKSLFMTSITETKNSVIIGNYINLSNHRFWVFKIFPFFQLVTGWYWPTGLSPLLSTIYFCWFLCHFQHCFTYLR